MKKVFPLLILLLSNLSISQDQTTNLDEVVVLSTKIDLPFSKNFRTVKIISSEDIKNSPVTNVSDLLQEITGIDVRRRGVGGVQGVSTLILLSSVPIALGCVLKTTPMDNELMMPLPTGNFLHLGI